MNELIEKQETALTQEKFEEMQQLMVSKGMLPSMAFSHELVPLGDGKYQLKKREQPIDTIDFDTDGIPYEVRKSMMKTGAEVTGFGEARPGAKYPGDANRLLDTEVSSLGTGEVESWEVH